MTDFQIIYDSYVGKVDEDLSRKEPNIFRYLLSSIPKCRKIVRHSLDYTLSTESSYDGYFNETLDDDEIDLLALQMKREDTSRTLQYYAKQKSLIGTRDFNSLPKKRDEMAAVEIALKHIDSELFDAKQQFYTYGGKS